MKSRLWDAISAGILGVLSTAVPAALVDNGGGLIYDTVLDITWAQPATLGDDWFAANTSAAALTLGGVSGWRLAYISVAAGAGPFTGTPVNLFVAGALAERVSALLSEEHRTEQRKKEA